MPTRFDPRPICSCSAYSFPHRIGGRCRGSAFTEFYYYNIHILCDECNCQSNNQCEVAMGQESITEAECFIDAKHYRPGEFLPLEIEEPEEPTHY